MSSTIPHHSTHTTKLLEYAKIGASQSQIAAALGITPSAVSQLMSNPEISSQLQEIREAQLSRSSALDAKYDEVEDKLLEKLASTIPLLLRPMEIATVLSKVNAAKRRGVAATTQQGPARILQLNLPEAIQAKFVLNQTNQVVSAGSQNLVTIQSANVLKLAEANHATPQTDYDEFGLA